PLDTPFVLDLKDMEALEADAQKARQLGYQGKLCVHPNQVDICNRLFLPTEEEIEFSKRVIAAFTKAEADGVAAILVEGKVIEYAQVARARQILRLVES
ncbi:CoA ester lyase, partial [Thermodesulfobacteriota bacterium]